MNKKIFAFFFVFGFVAYGVEAQTPNIAGLIPGITKNEAISRLKTHCKQCKVSSGGGRSIKQILKPDKTEKIVVNYNNQGIVWRIEHYFETFSKNESNKLLKNYLKKSALNYKEINSKTGTQEDHCYQYGTDLKNYRLCTSYASFGKNEFHAFSIFYEDKSLKPN